MCVPASLFWHSKMLRLIFQRSSSCLMHVCDGRWSASGNCLKEAPPWFAAEDGSLITSVCVTNFVWLCGRPMCWWRQNIALEAGQSSFWCHSFSSVCIGVVGCFSQSKDRCNSSPRSQSAQRSEVTAITALQRDAFLIWKLPRQEFGAVYTVSSLKGFLKPIFIFFLYRCHGSDFTELFGQRPQRLY